MLNIAICDDDGEARGSIRRELEALSADMGIPISVQCYPSGQALLFALPAQLDMLVIDIEMPGLNGIEAAGEMRRALKDLTIVFVTNFFKYALEGYKVGAYRYLLKPVNGVQIQRELGPELLRLHNESRRSLCVRNREGIFAVPMRDILYIEAERHRLSIHAKDGVFLSSASLSALEAELSGLPFFRCHKSYLVHLPAISELVKDSALLVNGESLPVSKHRKREMTNAFTAYLGGLL